MSPVNLRLHANVSELILYLKCPRQVYYTYREHELVPEISSEYIEHMLVKELAMSYAEVLTRSGPEKDSILETLQNEFGRVKNELDLIYSTELKGVPFEIIETAEKNTYALLDTIATNLSEKIASSGKDDIIKCINPLRTEPVLHSDRLKITGIPSAIVQYDDKMFPLLIKTGRSPENGVWGNDRTHIAALSMLVNECYDQANDQGFVEYAKEGKIRKVKIRADDRRQVLKIRDRVDKIKEGMLPELKEGKLCEHCSFKDICTTRSSLASKFF